MEMQHQRVSILCYAKENFKGCVSSFCKKIIKLKIYTRLILIIKNGHTFSQQHLQIVQEMEMSRSTIEVTSL